MSPMQLLSALLVAVCVAQLVPTTCSHHVAARDVSLENLVKLVGNKISQGLLKIEQIVNKAVNKVTAYKDKLENKALDVASRELAKNGVKVELRTIYQDIKANVSACARENNLKSKAMLILLGSLSCVADNLSELSFITESIRGMWRHGKSMVGAIQDVAANCTLQTEANPSAYEKNVEVDLSEDLVTDEEVKTLTDEVNVDAWDVVDSSEVKALTAANATTPYRPLRVLWANGKRLAHCVKDMYKAAKEDAKQIIKLIATLAVRAAVVSEFVEAKAALCISKQAAHFVKLNFDLGQCMAKKAGIWSFGK